MRQVLVEHLVQSKGIIICFDPITEFATGQTFEHVVGLLAGLSGEMHDQPGERLPHHVAVCVTKFDDLRLLKSAQALDLALPDSDLPSMPRVPDGGAREFMLAICRLSASGTAELVPKLIEQTFYPERVRYFVSSSIGFYIDGRTGCFDPEDHQNVVLTGAYKSRVRGSIHPINVAEPVVWLVSQISDGSPR